MGKAAAIFCSSYPDIDPAFNEAARAVVRALCGRGFAVVSGGTVRGTMKVVADEAVACGGTHVGVLPRFMQQYAHPDLTELVWTDTMSERKEYIRSVARDLAVVLPGGVGTMDEFFETLTLAKLGKYGGRILVCNFKGYYDGLRMLLDSFVRGGMLDAPSRALVEFPSDAEEFEKMLDRC